MVEVLGAVPSPNIAAAASVHPAVDDVPDGQSGQNHQDLFGRKHLNVLDLLSSYLNLINLLQLFKSRKEGGRKEANANPFEIAAGLTERAPSRVPVFLPFCGGWRFFPNGVSRRRSPLGLSGGWGGGRPIGGEHWQPR